MSFRPFGFIVSLLLIMTLVGCSKSNKGGGGDSSDKAAPKLSDVDQEFEDAVDAVKQGKATLHTYMVFEHTKLRPERRAEVVKLLETGVANPDPLVASHACKAMLRWGGKEGLPSVLKALSGMPIEKWLVRRPVIEAIGLLKDPSAVPVLVEQYKKDETNRQAIGTAIGNIGPPAEDAVLEMLSASKSDQQIRQGSVRILRNVGTAKSVAVLEAMLTEPEAKSSDFNKEVQSTINTIKGRLKKQTGS